jgi:hypothetical protein
MIHPVHQRDIRIDHVHNVALRGEISERLVVGLGKKPVGMPRHLMLLLSRLSDEPPETR